MRLKIWGCRGSVPSPGPETVGFGGNTSCIEVSLPGGGLIVLDAGTGIIPLGLELAELGSPETNSGIFIRCQDKSSISAKTCYEINIWDGRPEQDFATGGIVNVAKVITPVKTAGRWGTIVITASGPKMSVAVNGTRTAEGQHTQFARGPITLQYGGPGTVRFRNVQIKPL